MKFFPPKSLELTVALIKPHAVKIPPIVKSIKSEILDNKFFVIKHKRCLLTLELASRMYAIHIDKPFYPRLIGHMTSGPIECFILTRENCIKHWRNMMGITRSYEAHILDPHSIRGKYGFSNTRNVTHGSDSPETAENECSIFFPDFNIKEWYESEEIYFRNGYVKFDDDLFIHEKELNGIPELF